MADKFRVCPECGTRNKVKWELCVRCSTPLEDQPVSDGGDVQASPSASTSDFVEDQPTGGGFFWALAILVIIAGVAYAIVRPPAGLATTEDQPAARFVAPTLPPSAPPPSTLKVPTGEQKYSEARARLQRGDPRSAAALMAEVVQEVPDQARYRHLYGIALLRSNDRAAALEQLDAAVRLDASVAAHHADLGRALASAGRREDAMRSLERALDLQPQDIDTLRELTVLATAAGDKDRVLALRRRAVDMAPDDAIAQTELGQTLEDRGEDAQAVEQYRSALGRVPGATVVRARLAEVLYRQGKTDEAVALYRDGLDRAPESPILQRGLGSLLERMGRIDEAVLAYREYVRLAPSARDARELEERAARLARQGSSTS
jgi:predicted Zn-dependent protease